MIKLSKPSKMPCLSWSLQALDTCPGSKDSTGKLVDACTGCYATDGNYRYPNVIKPRSDPPEDPPNGTVRHEPNGTVRLAAGR